MKSILNRINKNKRHYMLDFKNINLEKIYLENDDNYENLTNLEKILLSNEFEIDNDIEDSDKEDDFLKSI